MEWDKGGAGFWICDRPLARAPDRPLARAPGLGDHGAAATAAGAAGADVAKPISPGQWPKTGEGGR
jgi:hypothetical protein